MVLRKLLAINFVSVLIELTVILCSRTCGIHHAQAPSIGWQPQQMLVAPPTVFFPVFDDPCAPSFCFSLSRGVHCSQYPLDYKFLTDFLFFSVLYRWVRYPSVTAAILSRLSSCVAQESQILCLHHLPPVCSQLHRCSLCFRDFYFSSSMYFFLLLSSVALKWNSKVQLPAPEMLLVKPSAA